MTTTWNDPELQRAQERGTAMFADLQRALDVLDARDDEWRTACHAYAEYYRNRRGHVQG